MNFDNIERSADLGEPINLYKFTYGPEPEDCYNYTDYEQPLAFEGAAYYPRAISRGDINSSGTTDKSTLEIRIVNTDPVAEMFRVYPPSFPVSVIVWQGHAIAQEFTLQWSGKVLSCAREGSMEAALTCEPSSVSMQRIGLRRHYQYMCPHVLYGAQCRANKAAATSLVVTESVTGRVITLSGLLSNASQFAGGLLEWENEDGRSEYRTVLSVAAVAGKTVLTISGISRGLSAGQSANLSKGCAHTLTDCNGVHANGPNFGGHPFIPTKNPLGRTTPFL